jgi:hypothetical protein
LKKLANDRIQFVDSIDVDETEIAASCLSVDEEKCNASSYCFYSRGECGLNLPKMNLVTSEIDNSVLYYSKLADEMVRYNRIKTFLFQHKNYLLFDTLNYNLRDNEMIVLQSILTQTYFANLIPSKHNIRLMNAYDTANPAEAFRKKPPLEMKNILKMSSQVEIVPDRVPIKYLGLKQCLLTGSIEITYPPTPYATFQFASDVIRLTINVSLTTNEIRDKLAELYNNYAIKYKIQIANILIQQGKKTFGSYIKAGTLEIKNMVYTEGYYLTNLDIWLLLEHYQIHSLLISHKHLLETNYNAKQFCFYTNVENENSELEPFLMIVNSAIKIETPPSYKYVEMDGNIQIAVNDLRGCISEMYTAISQIITIENYIKTFKPILTTKYVKKKPGYVDAPHQASMDSDSEKELELEPEPIRLNITDTLQVPDLAQTPHEHVRTARTRKNGTTKKAEHRHKSHAKKPSSASDS